MIVRGLSFRCVNYHSQFVSDHYRVNVVLKKQGTFNVLLRSYHNILLPYFYFLHEMRFYIFVSKCCC